MDELTRQYVDPQRWPQLVEPPHAQLLSRRAKEAHDRLEDLLLEHGVALDAGSLPNMVVTDGTVIDRIVARGWLGLAEGYLAGEWRAEPLPEVLKVLLEQPFEGKLGEFLSRRHAAGVVPPARPATRLGRTPGRASGGEFRGDFGDRVGELPQGLVELYTGATRSTGAGMFASAPRTSSIQQVAVPLNRSVASTMQSSQGADASHIANKREYSSPVDVTWFGPAEEVDRQDLDDAQLRRIDAMLEEAGVGPGDRVLELPSSGGQLAVRAALLGAHVDVLTHDPDHAEVVRTRVRSAGVAGAVRVELISSPIPSPRQWSGRYDVIFSVERMETHGSGGLVHFLKAIDRMLAEDGVAVVQSLVATSTIRVQARQSLDLLRAYVWPEFELSTVEDVRAATLNSTSMRVVAENHLGPHSEATAALWRANFLARERQAAAAGIDQIFRRLWNFHLALREALTSTGDMDCVQFVFEHR